MKTKLKIGNIIKNNIKIPTHRGWVTSAFEEGLYLVTGIEELETLKHLKKDYRMAYNLIRCSDHGVPYKTTFTKSCWEIDNDISNGVIEIFSYDRGARIIISVSNGHGEPYIPVSPMLIPPPNQEDAMALVTTIERDLNENLLCHEAEIAWPKQGIHNHPTFKADYIIASRVGKLRDKHHLKDVAQDSHRVWMKKLKSIDFISKS